MVWADGAGYDWNVYGQILVADGIPVGRPLAIANDTFDRRHPAVSYYDGAQGSAFLVTWDEQHSSPQNKDAYGR